MKADEQYTTLLLPAPKRTSTAGPRLYWRAVVKVNEHEIEWHSAECEAPLNDCKGCEP